MKTVLHALALAAVTLAAGLTQQPAAATPSSAPVLRVALSDAYNKLETWRLYGGFLTHLAQCTKLSLKNADGRSLQDGFESLDVLPEKVMMRALGDEKVDLMQLNTGLVPVAMDRFQALPFAVRGEGRTGTFHSYHLDLIVRAESPYRKPSDLRGKKIAHTTPGSNSGNFAPRAYFPGLGLEPEKGYSVVFSNGHERSIIGTQFGFWDAAAVASDQFERMAKKGEIRASDFRVLWSSPPFPASAWALNRNVPAATQQLVRSCTENYRFPKAMSALLDGDDRFVAIDAEKAYAPVRFVNAKASKP